MKILFAHQNFPGQFKHLARYLAANDQNQVLFVTKRKEGEIPGVRKLIYEPSREPAKSTHHYLKEFERGVLHGQAVVRVAQALKNEGFQPDLIYAHPGWGESLYLKDIYPRVPLVNFCEWYYHAFGADAHFDPAQPVKFDSLCRLRTRNGLHLLNLEVCDVGVVPTRWQLQQFPKEFRSKLTVIHDGIDTETVRPNEGARFDLGEGRALSRADEVLTYVARNLEPYRGFPSFMRALPSILARRPDCQVVILGGDDVSYGGRLPEGESHRQKMLEEVAIDHSRVHFLGRVPYARYLALLQVSSAHVYLTYPFVLSWSLLEAMAAGCLVIGSNTPPVAEVITHGETGFLVDFFSPEAIADKVVEALEIRRDLTAVSVAARQHVVAHYDLKTRCLPAQVKLISALVQAAARRKATSA